MRTKRTRRLRRRPAGQLGLGRKSRSQKVGRDCPTRVVCLALAGECCQIAIKSNEFFEFDALAPLQPDLGLGPEVVNVASHVAFDQFRAG